MDGEIVHLKSNTQELDSWIILNDGEVIGHIYMKVELDNKIKFLDAWVHPDWRKKGIYRRLWETRWDYVLENYNNFTVYAWCKQDSLPLLIEKGFQVGEIATYVEKKI